MQGITYIVLRKQLDPWARTTDKLEIRGIWNCVQCTNACICSRLQAIQATTSHAPVMLPATCQGAQRFSDLVGDACGISQHNLQQQVDAREQFIGWGQGTSSVQGLAPLEHVV